MVGQDSRVLPKLVKVNRSTPPQEEGDDHRVDLSTTLRGLIAAAAPLTDLLKYDFVVSSFANASFFQNPPILSGL